jgi:signal transduction histidine kinase
MSSLFIIKERLLGKDLKLEMPLERAERGVKRCNNIIEEMLYYTRERAPDFKVVEFDKWLDEMLDEHEIPKEIRLTRKLSAGIEIPFDPEQLRRCMINVVNNACEAMMEKSEPQTEESEGVEDNRLIVETGIVDNRLSVRIIDSGPGISQEKLEKVFEPLYSTKGFGAGLGLSIVKQIIERHKGGIEIESKPMKGTAVTFWLPIN